MSLLLCLHHAQFLAQISDIAKGLCYLHSCSVLHGNLIGVCRCHKSCFTPMLTPVQPNILVDDAGSARIGGFGHTTVAKNPDSMWSSSGQGGHEWSEPAVLIGEAFSKEADIFSFAMVMAEVCHGGSPTHRTLANYCSTDTGIH